MRINVLIALIAVGLLSCNSKTGNTEDVLTPEQIEVLDEHGRIGVESIEYEGVYQGEINGNKIKLTLESNSFELLENDKKSKGDWSRIDDGTIIELLPESGSLSVRYFGYSDENTWIVLSDSMTYVEPEQFLIRTSK